MQPPACDGAELHLVIGAESTIRQRKAAAALGLCHLVGLAERHAGRLAQQRSTCIALPKGSGPAALRKLSGAKGQGSKGPAAVGTLLVKRVAGGLPKAAPGSGIRFVGLAPQGGGANGATAKRTSYSQGRSSSMAALYKAHLDKHALPEDYAEHFARSPPRARSPVTWRRRDSVAAEVQMQDAAAAEQGVQAEEEAVAPSTEAAAAAALVDAAALPLGIEALPPLSLLQPQEPEMEQGGELAAALEQELGPADGAGAAAATADDGAGEGLMGGLFSAMLDEGNAAGAGGDAQLDVAAEAGAAAADDLPSDSGVEEEVF